MLRALRDPRWVGGLVVAVVFAVVCVQLAQWQLHRRVARAERNAAVLTNYDSAPQALGATVGDPSAALPAQEQWEPVLLQGSYDPAGTVLVRNRVQEGSNGYLVAVPFTTAAGPGPVATVLLVRGWLPSGSDASTPAVAVPAPPAGPVSVLARLRSAEPAVDRPAPAGQAYRVVPDALLPAGAEARLTGAYGVVATEDGAGPAALSPVPRPDTDPGPHLAYGVQWYMFAVAGLGIWVVLARRNGAELAAAEADDGPGAEGPGGPGGPGGPYRDGEDPQPAGTGGEAGPQTVGAPSPGRGGRGARGGDWVYRPGG